MTTGIQGLYQSARVFLWVEDMLTYGVLTELWAGSGIQVEIAGNRAAVEALVNDVPPEDRGRVFGLVDVDTINLPPTWSAQTEQCLKTPGHEFENLLLQDFETWARCTLQEPPRPKAVANQKTLIETTALQFAETMVWWMAFKRVSREIRVDLTQAFPSDPSVSALMDAASAAKRITDAPFFKNVVKLSKRDVPQRIATAGNALQADLSSGRWRESFSGKEVFRHLRGRFDRVPFQGTAAEHDEDFARRLARRMKPSPPQVFSDLRDRLLRSP